LEPIVGALDVRAGVADAGVVLIFASNRSRLDAELPSVLAAASASAILWIACPNSRPPSHKTSTGVIIHDLAPRHRLDTVS
jgi:hypothetical protein